MSDSKEEKTEKASKVTKVATIKMQHELHSDWTLSIGGDDYPVVDGAVEVPEWHYAAALQSGFRPA